ncbi:MAG: hypothetical protein KA792_00260 [Bacteroidales bacterium]|nr:hypothetical protein [Bacteroidales bacterium]
MQISLTNIIINRGPWNPPAEYIPYIKKVSYTCGSGEISLNNSGIWNVSFGIDKESKGLQFSFSIILDCYDEKGNPLNHSYSDLFLIVQIYLDN